LPFIFCFLSFQSFEDLHKLWFVLYKERNLLLTARLASQRNSLPVKSLDENRYINVKRSMGAIKKVLDERNKIKKMIQREEDAEKEKLEGPKEVEEEDEFKELFEKKSKKN
jgi:large subunit ribosomal protein L47